MDQICCKEDRERPREYMISLLLTQTSWLLCVYRSDLVQMANIDTPNILNTLHTRHGSGDVYTSVGQKGILISINPYRWVPGLYDVQKMHEHHSAFATTSEPTHPSQPRRR